MTNTMAKRKERTQLRLGDVYRYIVTGELTPIVNLENMRFHNGMIIIQVPMFHEYGFNCVGQNGTHDEKALRAAIKEINKIISEV